MQYVIYYQQGGRMFRLGPFDLEETKQERLRLLSDLSVDHVQVEPEDD